MLIISQFRILLGDHKNRRRQNRTKTKTRKKKCKKPGINKDFWTTSAATSWRKKRRASCSGGWMGVGWEDKAAGTRWFVSGHPTGTGGCLSRLRVWGKWSLTQRPASRPSASLASVSLPCTPRPATTDGCSCCCCGCPPLPLGPLALPAPVSRVSFAQRLSGR